MGKGNKGNTATAVAAKPVATAKGKSSATATPAPKKAPAFDPLKVVATLNVAPDKLKLREQKFRGRSKDISDDELNALADSLKERQLQPIQARAIKGTDEYEVIFGNTRTLAAQKKIIPGFKTNSGKEIPAQPDFTLRVEVVDIDDEEAFIRTVTENVQRFQTSAIDDAINHEMLRTDNGMSDAAITRLYGYGHQASVTSLKKLLLLPTEIQDKIHNGDMTKQAGFVLVDWCRKKEKMDAEGKCDKELCDKIIAAAPGGEDIGNVGQTAIGNAIKEYEKAEKAAANGQTTGNDTGTPATGDAPTTPVTGDATTPATGDTGTPATVFPLTLKEFKTHLEEFAGLDGCPTNVAEHCATTISFLKGEIEKDAYFQWLVSSLGNG